MKERYKNEFKRYITEKEKREEKSQQEFKKAKEESEKRQKNMPWIDMGGCTTGRSDFDNDKPSMVS